MFMLKTCDNLSDPIGKMSLLSDDLPDGSCFSRVLKIETSPKSGEGGSEIVLKKCEYIGSFPVTCNDHSEKTAYVRTQLQRMRERVKKKKVLFLVSPAGVKICGSDGKGVLMAHALRRISFATCDPEHRQFSFLAREPNGHMNTQYCHSFLTETPAEAEELSRVIGSTFRMAYAQQLAQPLASPTPSSHSDSELQRRRTSHSVVILGCQSAAFFSATCRNDVSCSPRPAARSCWAKKHIGKSKHHDPMAEQALEMSCRPLSPSVETSLASNGLLEKHSSPMNRSQNNGGKHPESLPVVDIWSPLGGGSSSEENNSPTDLNSCKQIKDKPPLLKNVEVHKGKDAADDSFKKDHGRPSSGGYINEGSSWDFASTVRVSSFNCGSKHDSRTYSPRKLSKSLLSCNSQSPSAPPTDEDNLLESLSETSSKRSSQSSCDQNNVSSVFSEQAAVETVSSKLKSHASSSSSNSSVTPPPPPERHDSLSAAVYEEKELRGAPWFQAGIPREIALEVLAQEPVGSFMVRESTSKPGCFALSLRVPREFHQSGIAHYLIMRTNRGYKIKGFTKEFGTLTALITHHSVMPELLPCPLSLSRYNPTYKKHDSEDMMDIDEDPDYLLSDFRKMLADINA